GFTVYETVAITVVSGNQRIDGDHPAVRPVIDVHGIGSIMFKAVVGYAVIGYPFGSIEGHLYATHAVIVDVVAIDFHIAAIVYEDAVFAIVVDVVAGDGHPGGREHPDGRAGVVAGGRLAHPAILADGCSHHARCGTTVHQHRRERTAVGRV